MLMNGSSTFQIWVRNEIDQWPVVDDLPEECLAVLPSITALNLNNSRYHLEKSNYTHIHFRHRLQRLP